MNITAIYHTGIRHGLTVNATAGNMTAPVAYSAVDNSVFGGKGVGRDYTITYPAEFFPSLKHGDAVIIRGENFTVRGAPESIRDAQEMTAKLSHIG